MEPPLRIIIACYPSIGGSGILACALGEALARLGHHVHFVSYEQPVRLDLSLPGIHFHSVAVNTYGLFRFPDYTLPLSVKIAEICRTHSVDLIHAHYAVPHATAAILATDMLPPDRKPRVVSTLHGTDTTLLGRDPGYGPAIRHALTRSDGVTAVSHFLAAETHRLLEITREIRVVHNFFEPHGKARPRGDVRAELGLAESDTLILHHSNVRPIKRIDLLLETVERLKHRRDFKVVILAGGDFSPFRARLRALGLESRVIVREEVRAVEDYLNAADLGLFTSDSESFCLSILEAMTFGCPSVSTRVGGIPEVVEHGQSGWLAEPGNVDSLAEGVRTLLDDVPLRQRLGREARQRAARLFSTANILPQYLQFYRDVLGRNR